MNRQLRLSGTQAIDSLIPDVANAHLKPALKRRTVSIMSPLRYPGSKRRLANYISQAIRINCLRPALFVEPFAGGASVALQLLNDGIVDKIGLADLDPLVAAFWEVAFFDTEWLIEQVHSMEITMNQWKWFKHSTLTDPRDKALACLFLNRTSFSGILAPGAGPIGGTKQSSEYKIDCRFPRETLIRRIQSVGSLADRVAFVWNRSWQDTISEIQYMQTNAQSPHSVFYYLDPPFFEKAERLYTYYFQDDDHKCLKDTISELPAWWILSYDAVNQVKVLYGDSGADRTHVEVLYSTARSAGNRPAREAIVTNLPRLPNETRLWRKSEEWSDPS